MITNEEYALLRGRGEKAATRSFWKGALMVVFFVSVSVGVAALYQHYEREECAIAARAVASFTLCVGTEQPLVCMIQPSDIVQDLRNQERLRGCVITKEKTP